MTWLDRANPDGQLVAVAGEEIVCQICGLSIARFKADAYGYGPWPYELTGGCYDTEGCFACPCGASPTKASGRGRQPVVDIDEAPVALVHLRSGTWTGWRSIGAE